MRTGRLYWEQPYATSFRSEVLALRDAGGAHWVLLARSLFYPTSGGQHHDLGTLGGQPVLEVRNEGEAVWHLLEGDAPAVGSEMVGEIDWPRRYRHMQRHSGQHLLSQAFVRLSPAFSTRAVSLSGPVCTLDLAGEPDEADLAAATTDEDRRAAEAAVAAAEAERRDAEAAAAAATAEAEGRSEV